VEVVGAVVGAVGAPCTEQGLNAVAPLRGAASPAEKSTALSSVSPLKL
jgi:hypothetical protein